MTDSRALWQFVENQLNARDMSLRAFSKMVGVTHATLLRLRDNPAALPSIETLGRLASGTHTDISALIGLIYPELIKHDVRTLILAGQIEQLSQESRNVIEAIILGESLQRKENRGNLD